MSTLTFPAHHVLASLVALKATADTDRTDLRLSGVCIYFGRLGSTGDPAHLTLASSDGKVLAEWVVQEGDGGRFGNFTVESDALGLSPRDGAVFTTSALGGLKRPRVGDVYNVSLAWAETTVTQSGRPVRRRTPVLTFTQHDGSSSTIVGLPREAVTDDRFSAAFPDYRSALPTVPVPKPMSRMNAEGVEVPLPVSVRFQLSNLKRIADALDLPKTNTGCRFDRCGEHWIVTPMAPPTPARRALIMTVLLP